MCDLRSIAAIFILIASTHGAHSNPAEFTVTTSEFTGSGSLTEAVALADSAVTAGALGAHIHFDLPAPGQITFDNALIISRTFDEGLDLIIDGGGEITLSGGGVTQLFIVDGESGLLPDPDAPAGHLILRGLTLRDAFSADTGGAIYSDGVVRLENSVLRANQVDTGGDVFACLFLQCDGGGAIFNGSLGQLIIVESELNGNETRGRLGDMGGAISNAGVLIVSDSLLFNNRAGEGGGAIANSGLAAILDSQLVANEIDGFVTGLNGGGALLNGTSFSGSSPFNSMTIARTLLQDNRALGQSSDGGAIASNAELVVAESLFVGNEVRGRNSQGGALANNSASLLVLNSTFSGNAATGPSSAGGALKNGIGQVNLVHTSFVGNAVTDGSSVGGTGGAITASDSPLAPFNITNSLFVNNQAIAGTGRDVSGAIHAFHTLFEDPSDLIFESQQSVLLGNGAGSVDTGNGLFPISAIVTSLADNGGPTPTHAIEDLASGGVINPVLDTGNTVLALEALNSVSAQALEFLSIAGVNLTSLSDQRGVVPTAGVRNDLGAFEFVTNDADNDGVPNASDNCRDVVNPGQVDADADGFGNPCDPDINNDGVVNVTDLGLFRLRFFSADGVADFNVDGVVNVADLGILRSYFFQAPGP